METAQAKRLEGLSEKIFLDRYAMKDPDTNNTKVGDLVLVLTKDDPKFPAKEVGDVIERQGRQVSVKLRNGTIVESDIDKLTLSREKTPEELWDRLSSAMASVEASPEKTKEWKEKFRYILDDWKLVPGGRIAAGAGVSDELTLFNCYVIPSPHDSRGGIIASLGEMTEIMARGGGVGINMSSLRPRRAIVQGVNGSSSGAVSWGGLFSYATGLIEQGGSRRGALMLMINDWHPDVLDFITVKQTMGQVTNANLSVCVSNGFMKAVKEDLDWELVFPDTKDPEYNTIWNGDLDDWKKRGKAVKHFRTVKAREVWHTIIECAWKSAEPGVVFMEYYNQMSNSWYFNPIISTNPCFHPDTRISSQFGLMRIEDLFDKMGQQQFLIATDERLNNQVQVVNGRSYEVAGVSMKQATVFPTGTRETLEIRLHNGMLLKVTPEHKIYTTAGWKEAGQLGTEDVVYIQSGEGKFADTDALGADWGKFLGWITGRGWVSKRGEITMEFSHDHAEAIPLMIGAGHSISGIEAKVYMKNNETSQILWWKQQLIDRLLELGVQQVKASAKEVPAAIFTASKPTVVAFLQGLFSADGTVHEEEMYPAVRMSSCSEKLLQDVQQLLINLGINSSIEQAFKSSLLHELIISGSNLSEFNAQIGFLLSAKQEMLNRISHPARKIENFCSPVESINKGGTVTVYDITEPVTHSLIANGFVVHNCGEQGLPAWGVCNLSAVNLSKFYDEKKKDVEWDELAKVVRYSVRFLDNVIDKTPYHFEENEKNQKSERRVGLGTMGLAELMIKLEMRYGSPESLVFLDKLYGFMAKESYIASAEIAGEKGSFTHYEKDKFLQSGFMKVLTSEYPEVESAILKNGMRNVTVITQAPTGSTGTMVDTSTGIEPYFAFEYYRQSRLGFDKQYVPIAQRWKDAHPSDELPAYFNTAMDLSAKDHVRVQAAIQKWVDSSISKTANCPADFTIDETKELYELAFDLGCKGVTMYRDGSRDVQVLQTESKEEKQASDDKKAAELNITNEISAQAKINSGSTGYFTTSLPTTIGSEITKDTANAAEYVPIITKTSTKFNPNTDSASVTEYGKIIALDETLNIVAPSSNKKTEEVVDKQYKRRPQVLRGSTYKFNTPFGMAYITINDLNGSPVEIFLNVGKAGSDVFAMSEALGRVCSLFLRYGDHGNKVSLLIKHLKGIGGSGAIGFGPNRVESIADAVAQALENHIESSFYNEQSIPPSASASTTNTGTAEITGDFTNESQQSPTTQGNGAFEKSKLAITSKDLCPSCGSASLLNVEGCKTCTNCGFSKCS